MWSFKQKTGELFRDGVHVATGYAGAPGYVNNPEAQTLHKLGPLPVGRYSIGAPYLNAKTGPYTLNLIPAPTNEMFGRDSFRIHGDSLLHPGTASEGCIILPRAIRELIWNSNDHQIEVLSGEAA